MESYIPSRFRETRESRLLEFVRTWPLCTLVTQSDNDFVLSHVPALLYRDEQGLWLETHVARANDLQRLVREGETRSVAVFTGPQAYISPAWYPSAREHGKSFPTWNYVAVHAHGTLEPVEDPNWLHDHVERLTTNFEAGQQEPWTLADVPSDFLDSALTAIVGVRMRVDSIVGAYKLARHKPIVDRETVVTRLEELGDTAATNTAAMMRQTLAESSA